MATFNLTTTPTVIDDGSSEFIDVKNTTTDVVEVIISRGGNEVTRLRPGAVTRIEPEGLSVSAAMRSGLGTIDVRVTGQPIRTTAFGMLQATGVQATDSATLQAAHDALPASGGVINLGPANYAIQGVVFTKTVRLVGQGCSAGTPSSAGGYPTEKSMTRLICSSPTATCITFSGQGHASQVENLHIQNTSQTTPSAGAGLAVTAQLAGMRFRMVTIGGFYRNFDINGYEWYMEMCESHDFVNTGLRIANPLLPDAGDMGIINCQFIAGPTNNATCCIEWNSAGGIRYVGNKMNKRGAGTLSSGLYIHPTDGISTSVFHISDSSFENMNYGIYADDAGNTGSGNISKMNIVGCEFLCPTKGITFARLQAGKVGSVVILGNVFSGGNTAGISLANVSLVTVGANQFASNITIPGRLTKGAGVVGLITLPNMVINDTVGTAVLNGTTPVVINTASVTASSVIQVTINTPGGTPGAPYVASRVAGTSFSVVSQAGDTSTIGWTMFEPI